MAISLERNQWKGRFPAAFYNKTWTYASDVAWSRISLSETKARSKDRARKGQGKEKEKEKEKEKGKEKEKEKGKRLRLFQAACANRRGRNL